MKEGDIIIEMTPFTYEDGQIYYFNITKRGYSNDYHDLWVYQKVEIDDSNWFRSKTRIEYQKLNTSSEIVSVKLDVNEIKRDIKKIIQSQKAHIQIKGWDGFVGDVPKDLQTQMTRDAKLNQII
jgi:hypothetical protein